MMVLTLWQFREEAVRHLITAGVVAFVIVFSFPQLGETKTNIQTKTEPLPITLRLEDRILLESVPVSTPVPELPVLQSRPPKIYLNVEATAYSSTVDQTDGDPFTTASGMRVAPDVIACNFLPIGTIVRFPKIFGEQTFIVGDRMAQRFQQRVDFWFPSRQEALQFGFQRVAMEVQPS